MALYFEKPQGTRDLLPEKVMVIREVIAKAQQLIKTWGYEEIETPIIEYFQTVGVNSQIPEEKLIKFLDSQGKTVVLRPDLTTPIARFAASVYKDVELPLRLMYLGSAYRNNGSRGLEEVKQLDIELIGVKDLTGDAEVIALALKTILSYPVQGVKLAIGHTKFLKALLQQIGCCPKEEKKLFNSLLERDYVSFRQIVEALDLTDLNKDHLFQVLKLRGSLDEVIKAKNWFNSKEWQDIFKELESLWQILEEYAITQYINYDLTLVGSQNYYTGLIYNGYCAGHPYPICSGGRYDNLLSTFDRTAPATGFAVYLDDLIKVIDNNYLDEDNQKIIILYSKANRLKAINEANQLREAGKIVVMAPKEEVSSSYLKIFNQVIQLN